MLGGLAVPDLGSVESEMSPLEVDERSVETPDGARLAYYDTGGTGPALIFANGLGGPFSAWRYQVDYLRDRYRIVSWDYRGLYHSARPPGNPPRVDVPIHVDDLELVLKTAGVERAAFVGWSMGVQVILEFYERHPGIVSHLVLLNGTYGRPFDTVAVPLAARVIPVVVQQAHRFHGVGAALLSRASRWPETVLWMKRLGFIGSTLDEDLFREMALEFASLDLDIYFRMLSSLGEHDAAHVLETVRVPTLVITGERDAFTPRQLAQQMARRVPNCEILLVRGATHYTAVEYPELVNLRIEKFFREHGYV